MNITTRRMKTSDYEAVRHIDILTQKQYLGQDFESMNQEEQEDHLVSRKSEFQINLTTGYCFVAEEDNKIIGFLLAYETLPFRGTVYVNYIGIHPENQGQGIGSLLYDALIDKTRQNGLKKIKALINIDNPKSIRLHQKTGFSLSDCKEAVLNL